MNELAQILEPLNKNEYFHKLICFVICNKYKYLFYVFLFERMLDLVICVFGCDTIEKYKAEILKINETWGEEAEKYGSLKILFFLGEEITDLIGDQYIHLPNVKNDYLSASYKQFLGLKYISDYYPSKFTFCCGTDTYINIPKMLQYIDLFNYQSPLYIGGHGTEASLGEEKIYFHSGGGGFLLSFECMLRIDSILENAVDNWLDICKTKNADQALYTASDVALAYYVQQPTVAAFVFHQPNMFMGCNHRGIMYGYYPCHKDSIDIRRIITVHSMSLADFDEFTAILKENDYFLEYLKN